MKRTKQSFVWILGMGAAACLTLAACGEGRVQPTSEGPSARRTTEMGGGAAPATNGGGAGTGQINSRRSVE